MNPANMMQFMQSFHRFKNDHPKFVSFLKYVADNRIEEGTVIEVTVQKPGESAVTSNIKVTQADLEMFESLKNMRQ